MKNYQWLKVCSSLFFIVLFFSCSEKSSDTLKLGVSGPYSGDLASYGIPSRQAAESVTAKWNANGGLLGKQIELIAEDDQGKEEVVTNAATKLVSSDVFAVIGHITSGGTQASLSIYGGDHLVSISPSATVTNLTLNDLNPYFFRTIAHDNIQAGVASHFILETLQSKRVAILHDQGTYGKGFVSALQNQIEKSGVEVVLFDGIEVGAPDYSAVITRVASLSPDLLIWGGYHPELTKLLGQMRSRGIDTPVIGPDSLRDQEFIATSQTDSEGVYMTGPTTTTTLPLYQEAHDAFLETYNEEPGAFFYNAYAATEALLQAVDLAGSTDSDAIRDALKSNVFKTPIGDISFDKNGDITGYGFSVYQVVDGEFITAQ